MPMSPLWIRRQVVEQTSFDFPWRATRSYYPLPRSCSSAASFGPFQVSLLPTADNVVVLFHFLVDSFVAGVKSVQCRRSFAAPVVLAACNPIQIDHQILLLGY